MTYGEETTKRLIAENEWIAKAALAGDQEGLRVLMSLAAQTGYTDGMSEAAHTVGVAL